MIVGFRQRDCWWALAFHLEGPDGSIAEFSTLTTVFAEVRQIKAKDVPSYPLFSPQQEAFILVRGFWTKYSGSFLLIFCSAFSSTWIKKTSCI